MDLQAYKRFPKQEYEWRWQRAREAMRESRLEGLLITEGNNYCYFAGATRDFSFSRPTIMLFPREAEPILLVQWFVRERTRRETWVGQVRTYDTLGRAPVKQIIDAMREIGMDVGRVGAELGFEQRLGISYQDFEELRSQLPKAQFVDTSNLLWSLRMIKSQAEIECIRKACQVTSKAYERLFATIGEGMSESEVVKLFFEYQRSEAPVIPWALANSDPENYKIISGSGGRTTDAALERGNLLWIDGGCSYREYWSDFSRMASLGPPSDKQRKMYDLVNSITKKCVQAIRPGVRASEIDNLNRLEWDKAGFNYPDINFAGGRIGHGMGLMVTEPPHIASYDNCLLKPGMVVTIEPGIATEYGCFHIEENVLVTEGGNEILSTADRELKVI